MTQDVAPPGRRPAGQDGVSIPVESLLPADSPRLGGEDRAHVLRLAESDADLPPILVHRETMRVIDGMHRLHAAMLNGQSEILVEFFEGSEADAFLRAVELNVSHGLPLSLSDRKAAAGRILNSCPHLSDRAIAGIAGLAAKTVAALRSRSSAAHTQLHGRLGHDGRVRPLDPAEGRRRAAELIGQSPDASLRAIAASAGISPGTVRDVRLRLQRGEDPVRTNPQADQGSAALPGGPDAVIPGPCMASPPGPRDAAMAALRSAGLLQQEDQGSRGPESPGTAATRPPDAGALPGRPATGTPRAVGGQPQAVPSATILPKLSKDPSLRLTEAGRELLRWLHGHVIGNDDWANLVPAVPPHCGPTVAELARQTAEAWYELARQLERRSRK